MKRLRKILPWILVVLGGSILLAGTKIFILDDRVPIPSSIRRQVGFVLMYPKPSNTIKLNKATVKYDSVVKQVSFIVTTNGRTIIFSEQSAPDQFADIPEYYPKFISQLQGYATFTSAIGRVDLTRPTDVKNQVAVMNAKGTLVFARSNGDLSEDDWKHLFNTLTN